MSCRFASLAWLAVPLLLTACGPSDEDLKRELAEVVAASNACEKTSDCAAAFISCPLGCYAAVNASKKAAVESKAQELKDQRGSGPTECECDAEPEVDCQGGRCALVP